eukprot:CAMPEP_0202339418 /NCGR_PEP_ID=MMETSP1126-20121109/1291_1 /ASSEMBLY_ACC=CAM_ASM_000457 /TAXON_ID=3047 /ORGANISM="Dunaliella tertiolecta, Strain CCMP1320" /LENGTH=590 /DNA_ID=CAMNT_0048929971 /DNA_START=925 /DNA_END=2697 /DNA_ORIENTATION=-
MAEPWVSEAIIDFLRGPLYVHPLMEFIDDKCLIFTTEEENKLEYTQVHEEFKELVDKLLTEFLEELGTKPEAFFETVTQQLDKDKFTEFVVNTILTVDDFLMFKAMMVRRNVDLTNQVLEAMEELRKATLLQQQEAEKGTQKDGKAEAPGKAEKQATAGDEELEKALQVSLSVHDAESRSQNLLRMMRQMQLEDEDVALAIATAESFKESAAMQAELAELEMAVALSAALEEEKKRLAAEQLSSGGSAGTSNSGAAAPSKPAAPGPSAPPAASTPAPAAKPAAPAPAAPKPAAGGDGGRGAASSPAPPRLQHRPFPEPKPIELDPLPSFGEPRQVGSKQPPPDFEPLGPAKIKPNEASDKMSTIAAAAAAAAAAASSRVPAAQSATPAPPQKKDAGPTTPAPLKVDDKPPPGPGPSETPRPGKFVPAPLNLDVPTPSSRPSMASTSSSIKEQDSSRSLGKFGSSFNTHSRAAGFQSDSSKNSTGNSQDLAAIRKAAMEAAATQKNLMLGKRVTGGNTEDDSANTWLKEAKLKLVAQKKLEREAEMQAYAAEKGRKPGKEGESKGADDIEARRAALRDRLASKFKQDLINE